MENWSKKQILKSGISNATCNNITIRLKANGFVVYGKDYMSKALFLDDYSFPRGFQWSQIKEVMNVEYSAITNEGINIKLIYPDNYFSIVPQSFFSETELSSYFIHALSVNDLDLFDYYSSLTSIPEVVSISAIKKTGLSDIKDVFKSAELISETKMLLDLCYSDYKLQKIKRSSSLYLNFQNDKVEEILFVDGGLVLMNRIEYHTIENFIYYILNTITQTKQSHLTTDVVILGDVQKQSSVILALTKYFERVHFLSPDGFDVEDCPAHSYYIELNA